jgi:hypothetical protein
MLSRLLSVVLVFALAHIVSALEPSLAEMSSADVGKYCLVYWYMFLHIFRLQEPYILGIIHLIHVVDHISLMLTFPFLALFQALPAISVWR